MASNPLKKPAIAMIVAGTILALYSLLALFILASVEAKSGDDMASILRGVFLALDVFSLILSGFVVYGGVQMVQARQYTMCMLGAAAAVLGGLCQLLVGILLVAPVGVWAVLALRNRENRRLFLPAGASVSEAKS